MNTGTPEPYPPPLGGHFGPFCGTLSVPHGGTLELKYLNLGDKLGLMMYMPCESDVVGRSDELCLRA